MWHALSFLMRQVKCKLRDSFLSLLGSLLVLAVVLVARPISAIEITTDTVALWDLFPQNTQGENGIRLQHRAVGSTDYTDLSYRWDYAWFTLGVPFNVPDIYRDEVGKILAHPSAVNQCWFDRDSAIQVQLEGALSYVHITGTAIMRPGGSGSVWFYIYKGADNWDSPL